MIPKDHDRSSIDIWFQDEARFGQQNTTTRLWAEKAQDHEPLGSSNVNMLIYLALFVRLQAQQKQ